MAVDDDELRQYRAKRDPTATNEPFAVVQPTSGETWGGDFVVHLHDATRRHYDLRLQVGSVLKSFAVPRGPSLDPREKRLAVQTEDHPMSYLDFEDVIPDDNYGAGPMIVWDIGRVRYLENTPEQGIPKGKLDFVLQGRKLRGRFALVETTERLKPRPKQRQWLLLKKQDSHVVEEPGPVEREPESVFSGLCVEQLVDRPKLEQALIEQARLLGAKPSATSRLTPMLCATEGASLTDSERIYELKLDGVRVLAHRSGDTVQLNYRSGRVAGVSFPEIQRAVQTLFASEFVIDGEIVAFDEAGRPNFQRLAKRFAVTKPFEVRTAMAEVSAVFCVFDILSLGNLDLTSLRLLERKALLAKLVPGKGLIRYLDHIEGNGEPLIKLCEQRGLEGVISKVKKSTYHTGARSTDWVKHKVEEEDEFVVVGWVTGTGHRAQLGALELGSYRGQQLVYRGRVGSGFSDQLLEAMKQKLPTLATDAFQCIELPEEGMANSLPLKPEWVVRVRFLQWTPEGRLRMAVLREWVTGASPSRCVAAPREEIEQRALAGELPLAEINDAVAEPVAQLESVGQPKPRKVVLTNVDKVFWPEEGYTKGQLLTYYEQVAPWLLPHLDRRPVMLVRYPDGITGKSFYQWNVPVGTPDWIQTLTVREEEKDGKDVVTFLVDGVDSLLHIINLGCIPIHVLAARTPDLSRCDFLTIDFDLGEHPFSLAVRMALELRQLLSDVGLVGYPKTSGQSGLHVLIPMGGLINFDMAKGMVELLGRLLQRKFTEEATMERRVSKRGGRAYIDTGQTGRSRTIVGPYSVRAHPGGRVSTPVHWDEVHLALRPDRYTMFTVPDLLEDRGDPLEGWLDVKPDLVSVLGKLERWVRQ